MARRKQTQGICCLCGTQTSKGTMTKHLLECSPKHDNGKKTVPSFLIRVEFPYDKRYWLTVEAKADATLDALDNLLRGVWLECCGHLSEFSIGGMQRKLGSLLEVGMVFGHEYDFGSTTELMLTVLANHSAAFGKRSTRLLSYNTPLEQTCRDCEAPATQVCGECYYEELYAFCDEHAEQHTKDQHDDEDYMMMPIINSPRMGVCGYDGPGPESYKNV